MAVEIEIVNEEVFVEVGGSPGTVIPSAYKGRQVAHSGHLPNTVQAANTVIDCDMTADVATYLGDGEDLFVPFAVDAQVTGWLVVPYEGDDELDSHAWVPLGGGPVPGNFDRNANIRADAKYELQTGDDTSIVLVARRGVDADETAGGSNQRGLTLQVQGSGIEAATFADTTSFRVFETTAAPTVSSGEAAVTNLGYTASPTDGTITSSSGADATVPLATRTDAGLMSPADKVKVDDGGGGSADVDLGYTASPTGGTVTNSAGDDAEITVVDETNAGLMTPDQRSDLADALDAAGVRDEVAAQLVGGSRITINTTGAGANQVTTITGDAPPPGSGEANPQRVSLAEARAGEIAQLRSWAPSDVRAADTIYDFQNTTGLQAGARNAVSGRINVTPRTPGALPRTLAEIDARISIFARVNQILGITRDKFQQMVNAFTGGGWADAAGAGDLRSTHWYVGLPSATEWTAANIGTATWGQRFRVSPRRVNQWVPISQPIAIEDTAARAQARFNVRTTAEHDPDAEYIDNYPLKDVAPFHTDSTYNYYKIQVADIPVSASIQVQLNTPFETDPNHLTIPEVPAEVSNDEADTGTEPDTRLWSPVAIRRAINAFVTGEWIVGKITALAAAARLSYNALKDRPATHPGIVEVIDGPGPGLAIASSSQTARGALSAVAVTVDLDDDEYQHGLVFLTVDWTLSGRSSTTIGFDDDTSDPELTLATAGQTTLQDVRAFSAYTGSQATAENGVRLSVAPVRNGSGNPGDFEAWVGHDAENVLSVWVAHVGKLGALGYTAATRMTLTVISSSGASRFIDLLDTPGAIVADQPVYGNAAGDALEFRAPPSGGGTARSFALAARPAADVDATLTGSVGGAWVASDLATTAAVAADQAGRVLVTGKLSVEAVTDSTGGGDRYMTEIVLIRTRASMDTVLERCLVYGPRNIPENAANTSTAYNAANQQACVVAAWDDTAVAGDTYKLQGRCLTQAVSGTREVRYSAAGNGILVTPV